MSHSAVEKDMPTGIFDLMIEYGADIRGMFDEYNILQEAASNGNDAVIDIIIRLAPDLLNALGKLGLSPLHLAAEYNDVAVVTKLLNLGAQVHVVNRFGSTVMHTAAWFGSPDVIPILARHGAPINITVEKLPRRSPPQNWVPPLHHAIFAAKPNCLAVMEALIAAGASVSLPSSTGTLPIHAAAQKGNIAALTLLISHGASQ